MAVSSPPIGKEAVSTVELIRPARLRSIVGSGAGLAIIAATVGVLLLEASYVCQDVPMYDDWNFISLLQAFLNHQIGWRYFITSDNGHPVFFARAATYLAWRFTGLNLAVLRWCVVAEILLAGAVFCTMVWSDLVKIGSTRGDALVVAAPACAIALTLGQWEVLTIATGSVDAIAVNLLLLLALLLIDRWTVTDRLGYLVGALLAALLTSVTELQGLLVWPILGFYLVLSGGKNRNALLAILSVVFVCLVVWTRTHIDHSAVLVFAPRRLLLGSLILAGLPYMGQIHNQPVPALDIAVGFAIWPLTLMAGALYWRAPTGLRARMNKYAALIIFGVGTSLMIEIGRLLFGLDAMAASRYATAVLPWAWGLYGLLALSIGSSRFAAAAAAAQIVLIAVGVSLTDFEELQIAPFRRDNALQQIKVLRDGEGLNDRSVLGRIFAMDRPDGYLVAQGREFLATNKLSLFRSPRPELRLGR
jgi:hypothetical protein